MTKPIITLNGPYLKLLGEPPHQAYMSLRTDSVITGFGIQNYEPAIGRLVRILA